MLRIRLKRLGRKKNPFYRVVLINKADRRNGRALQEFGYYDPMQKQLKLDKAAIMAWVAKGAQPSETVHALLKHAADDGSLVQLTKKVRKEHAGEANQAKPVVEEAAAEACSLEAPAGEATPAEACSLEAPSAEETEVPAEA